MSRVVICNWRDGKHPLAGGAELYCERVAEKLHRKGHEVTLLTSRFAGAKAEEETGFGRIVRRGGTYTVYLFALLWLLTHRHRFDAVIDSQNGIPFFSPLVVSRKKPITLLIHHVHQQQFTLYFRWPMNRIGQWLERTGSRWVYGRRAVCVVSPSSRSEVRRRLRFDGPIFLAPCGQDPVRSPDAGVRAVYPRIVVVGRLVAHKRVDLLIHAFAEVANKLDEVRLDIVGDGPALPALRDLVGQLRLDDRVRFHGRVTDQRRDDLLDCAWLTASTSVGEGWGLSMIEAAARGVPAVALRVAGLQDSVVDGITGWLVDEPADLAVTIVQAIDSLRDESDALLKRTACQSWAGRFTWEATADRLLAVLASERSRLSGDVTARRTQRVSDAATIVDVDSIGILGRELSLLPGTDQIDLDSDPVRLLLLGADEEDARIRLAQMGVPPEAIRGCRLARPTELLGWTANVADLAVSGAPGEGNRA
jgi:glycosyltransferase involved in cell wall biosynthesis